MNIRILLALLFGVAVIAGCGGGGSPDRAVPTPPATNNSGSVVTGIITPVFDPSNGVERHLLSPPMVQHGIQVLLFVFPPGSEVFWNADGTGVIEHATCVEGEITVAVDDGDESVTLSADESVNFSSDVDHRFINATENPARVFVVIDSSRRGEPAVMRRMNPST